MLGAPSSVSSPIFSEELLRVSYVILLRRNSDLSWRMKAILSNSDDNKDIILWFGHAVMNFTT